MILAYGSDILHRNVETIPIRVTLLWCGIRWGEIGVVGLLVHFLPVNHIGHAGNLDEATRRKVETEVVGSLCEVLEMEGICHPLLALRGLDFSTLPVFDAFTDTLEVFKGDSDSVCPLCLFEEGDTLELCGWLALALEGDGDVLSRTGRDDGHDLIWIHDVFR